MFRLEAGPAPQLALLAMHRVTLPEPASVHVTATAFDANDPALLWVATDATGPAAGGLVQALRWTGGSPAPVGAGTAALGVTV